MTPAMHRSIGTPLLQMPPLARGPVE